MVTTYFSTTRSHKLEQLATPKVGSWLHVVEPSMEELEGLSQSFKLDYNLLLDALDQYESPRIERDGQSVYVFARYCFPAGVDIATEPLLIVHTRDHIITIMRNKNAILDSLLQPAAALITTQRTKTFLQILGAINNSYERHIHTISKRILGIRGQMRSKTEIKNQDFVEFIDIEEDLNEFSTALQSQAVMLRNLLNGRFLKLYESDRDLVEDLSLGTAELIELVVSRLKTISNTREAYSTIMANTLNKTFKKLTSISIFMTIPTITTGLYGMNLKLPLAHNHNAFWFILLIVMTITACAIWLFNKLKWI